MFEGEIVVKPAFVIAAIPPTVSSEHEEPTKPTRDVSAANFAAAVAPPSGVQPASSVVNRIS